MEWNRYVALYSFFNYIISFYLILQRKDLLFLNLMKLASNVCEG